MDNNFQLKRHFHGHKFHRRHDIFDHILVEEIDFDISHILWQDGPNFIIKDKLNKVVIITGRHDFVSFPHREKRTNYHTIVADVNMENSGDVVSLLFKNLYGCKTSSNLTEALKLHFSTIKFLRRVGM